MTQDAFRINRIGKGAAYAMVIMTAEPNTTLQDSIASAMLTAVSIGVKVKLYVEDDVYTIDLKVFKEFIIASKEDARSSAKAMSTSDPEDEE